MDAQFEPGNNACKVRTQERTAHTGNNDNATLERLDGLGERTKGSPIEVVRLRDFA